MITKLQNIQLIQKLEEIFQTYVYYKYDVKYNDETAAEEMENKLYGMLEAMYIIGAIDKSYTIRTNRRTHVSISNCNLEPLTSKLIYQINNKDDVINE